MSQGESPNAPQSAFLLEDLLSKTGSGHWRLDPLASKVTIRHKTLWGLTSVKVSFATVSGEGLLYASGVVEGRFELSSASLDTGNKKRDLHLRSDEFFGVDVNPLIVFTARAASAGSRVGTVVLAGDLQVKNVSRPLVLEADVLLPSPNVLVLNIETEIDRADFGITWNWLGMLKGNAQVEVLAHLIRQSGEEGS